MRTLIQPRRKNKLKEFLTGPLAFRGLTVVCLLLGSNSAAMGQFKLSSPDLLAGRQVPQAQVFNSLGCTGGNTSPSLRWQDFPKETKSFAITVYDPDAPTGSGFWHWIVYNVPATVTGLPQGAGNGDGTLLPAVSTHGIIDFGSPGYNGPCPPPGKPHRYVFTVHALRVDKLDLPANATPGYIGFTLYQHTLATAKLTARYGREERAGQSK